MRKILPILLIAAMLVGRPAHAQATWTATVLARPTSDSNGNQIVPLHFSDGAGGAYDVNDFVPFGAPATQVGDFVADVIAKLSAQATVFKGAPPVGSVVVPTAAAVAVIDQNAAIKATFLADYTLLKRYQTAISHGLISAADLDYIAQLNKTSAEFIANKAMLLALVDVGP